MRKSLPVVFLSVLALASATAAAAGLGLVGNDVDGNAYAIGSVKTDHVAVLVFLGTECPITNHYIPYLNEMAQAQPRVEFYGIVSDPTVTRKAAVEYRQSYAIRFPLLFDASGDLARRLAPTHTPEAFVLGPDGTIQYRGRIDDGYAGVGKPNEHAQSHDLTDAIAAVLAGQPVAVAQTPAVGCLFEAWGKDPLPSQVTWARDIAPILDNNCVSCHRTGEVAPFVLGDYSSAAKRAGQLSEVTQSRYMPPWKPATGWGTFCGQRGLDQTQIDLIAAWAKAGAPQGDSANLPPTPTFASGWQLGEPDLVLTPAKPFTVPAAGRDVYRAIVVPLGLPEDKWVTAVEFRPDAKTVVHHAILYLDANGIARKKESANTDGQPGYRSFGGPGFLPSGALGGWAPGAPPTKLPDGVGYFVKKGSDVVFLMHFHPDGKEHQDRSSLGLYFARKPVTAFAHTLALGDLNIDIPAGDGHYTRSVSTTLPIDVNVIGVFPHMHLIGKEMKVSATTPDGKVTPMIWIKDWDFRWQGQYTYAQPLHLPAGTRIDLQAVYDNSDDNLNNPNSPPKRVTLGEQTTDEMCYCFIQVMLQNKADVATLRKSLFKDLWQQGALTRGGHGGGIFSKSPQ